MEHDTFRTDTCSFESPTARGRIVFKDGQDTQNQPAGVLLVDKPQGITSHDVVDRVRRSFG